MLLSAVRSAVSSAVQSMIGTGLQPTFNLVFAGATALDPRVTFTRSTTATRVNALGVLESVAIDTPRFDYDPVTLEPKGLLIEEQRTNSIRNNTAQGAVAGTPGTLPTNWFTYASAGTGVTRTVTSVGVEGGVPYVDLRFAGTPSDTAVWSVIFESAGVMAATTGQTWSGSFWLKRSAGTESNVTTPVMFFDETNGSTFVTGGNSPIVIGTSWARVSTSKLLSGGATVNAVNLGARFSVTAGAAIDITLRIGLPQLELGAFATSVIPTTTAAATRAADNASVTATNFSNWFNPVEGTTLVEASTLPNVTASVLTYAISDGTFNQSIYGNFFSGNSYRGANVLDGGVNQANSIANFTGLTTTNNTKDAFAYKLNDFAESCNGVATRTDTAGTVPAVNRLYIGSSWSGNSNYLNGHIRSFKYYPRRLSDAKLQSITA